ncbi:hypothetical protein [Limosilactobacillus reuteri]|uniref:hypothetical protein n=1 Tax=Limosilactobacillus reuteri TaxID=1598 RepID=UPI001E4322FD|nr:hypothetical protein [Limosilactobacillus reuteri]MCC4381842.1 hypothetical protein [Limosilactobacillus reuteri]MCC4436596.1 hypothetical protein [Limosilactobacillus reuteri]MCC4437713.1 hypothetical protein [Limosilactobacillus reuteri]MCC4441664.1 hypothetical protein [Limosilactobacillus reuteri]MCC4443670.1 hypothetical protein [Limosilactobacillus reuteri]
MSHNDPILNTLGIKDKNIKIIAVEEAERYEYLNVHQAFSSRQYQSFEVHQRKTLQ